MSARDRILGRVRDAVGTRPKTEHPGSFESWRHAATPEDTLEGFGEMFAKAGGEVVRASSQAEAKAWLSDFAGGFATVTAGRGVPPELVPQNPAAEPAEAALGVSMARAAIAETGSLVMDARDGRRAQLLVPTHVVIVHRSTMHATLRDALGALRGDLPSAIGLHSGPSKSADIGQVMVKGVHGPGRVIALVVEA